MSGSVSSISILLIPHSLFKPSTSISRNRHSLTVIRIFRNRLIAACFEPEKWGQSSIPTYEELGFKEIQPIELETEPKSKEDKDSDLATSSSSRINLAGLDNERDAKRPEKDQNELGLESEELEQRNVGQLSERRGRQLTKRSNLLAKQVISIQSALSLGFISQLWVDTLSWEVLVIEVRPNLLSGEIERFLLEDLRQVGDVVLIQDEGVMEKDLQMAGLETLVGYNVITPGRQNIGKVRGYTFNINSGAVESLELDAFGMSIIPSSLVSTYALLVEDVLEVETDTVVVHEAAVLRIQRLTKGFWGSQVLGSSIDEVADYPEDLDTPPIRFDKGQSRRKTSYRQKPGPRKRADLNDWGLPKDYL